MYPMSNAMDRSMRTLRARDKRMPSKRPPGFAFRLVFTCKKWTFEETPYN